MSKFTLDDVKILLDALKAWETTPTTTGFMTDMIMTVLDKDCVTDAERRARSLRAQQGAKREVEIRHDQSIVLQAKLIELRNSMLATGDMEQATYGFRNKDKEGK